MSRTMVIVLAFLCVAAAATVASAQQPKWVGDYGLGLAVCRATQKPLLIVLEEPDAPMFKIRSTTLITQETNHKLLANYTLCRVDVTTPYGQSVAKCFKAEKFPFTAIIGKRGAHILYKKIGAFTERDWVTTLIEYKSGERKQVADEFCFT